MLKVKTISISAKASDLQNWRFFSEDGKFVEHEGYAPYISGLAGGDYIEVKIDNETGTIVGWSPVTDEKLEEIVASNNQDF